VTWVFWFLIGWFALSPLVTIALIGRPRKPLGPVDGVASLIIAAGLISLVAFWWPR